MISRLVTGVSGLTDTLACICIKVSFKKSRKKSPWTELNSDRNNAKGNINVSGMQEMSPHTAKQMKISTTNTMTPNECVSSTNMILSISTCMVSNTGAISQV